MVADQQFDVALSFAGEDRSYVEMVADRLKAIGLRVFYDLDFQADLWGKDLYQHLADVYQHRAKYTVVFASKHYAEKRWPRHELRAAQARAFAENQEYLLPARFDATELPGMLPKTGYLNLASLSPAEVALRIAEKLGHKPIYVKADSAPTPLVSSESGTASLDYTAHNGRLRIGKEPWLFETKWSSGGAAALHCYNDPSSIRGVALAPKGTSVHELGNASTLDYSSRSRLVEERRVIVIQNQNGFYCAILVDDVQCDTHGDAVNQVTIRFWILKDGSNNFTQITKG